MADIVPILALCTLVFVAIIILNSWRQTKDIQDKDTNSALATGGDPQDRQ